MPKILIVDDEKNIRTVMTKIMSEYGDCETAESGSDAVKKFQAFRENKEPFDLIILDHSMDDVTGLDVLKAIRTMEHNDGINKENRIKIIMVTANQKTENVKACIAAGCNHYILKPVKPDTMKEKLVQSGFLKETPPIKSETKD